MKIKTSYIFPPISVRSMDWIAYEDGQEEGASGYGKTEQEAIEDFKEAYEWRNDKMSNLVGTINRLKEFNSIEALARFLSSYKWIEPDDDGCSEKISLIDVLRWKDVSLDAPDSRFFELASAIFEHINNSEDKEK